MASLNRVTLIGHLGKDPELKYLPNGIAVCNFTIATSESWKDKATGEKKEVTEWSRCNAFDKLAEICGEYLKKGALVYVEGRLQTRKYQKDGQDHYATEIKVDVMKMLGPKQGESSAPTERPARPAAAAPVSGFDDMADDLPF